MPEALFSTYRERLPEVTFVLFGHETSPSRCTLKAYLEYYDLTPDRGSAEGDESVLMHLGCKWDAARPDRRAVTRYTWFPEIAMARILERLQALDRPGSGQGVGLEAITELFLTAANRVDRKRVFYLEVADEGSPRKSVDINLYTAGLTIRSVEGPLLVLGEHYGIPTEEMRGLHDRIVDASLGHIACGFDGRGRPFFTLYYELPGDQPVRRAASTS